MNQQFDLAQLKAWESQLQARLSELERKLHPILAEVDKTKRELALVGQLRNLEDDSASPDARAVLSIRQPRPAVTISDSVLGILEEAGRPLHISDIRQRFLASGRTIPGQGNESNLLSHMVRDARIVRVAKGTYTLHNVGMPVVKAPAKPRRGTKRARSRKARSRSTKQSQKGTVHEDLKTAV